MISSVHGNGSRAVCSPGSLDVLSMNRYCGQEVIVSSRESGTLRYLPDYEPPSSSWTSSNYFPFIIDITAY